MPFDGLVASGGGGGGRHVGEVKEGGGGRPASMEEGGGGGAETRSALGGGGGGRPSLVGLVTVCRVGTDGGGTAMPRLDLYTRPKENRTSATVSNNDILSVIQFTFLQRTVHSLSC